MLTKKITVTVTKEVDRLVNVTVNADMTLDLGESLEGTGDFTEKIRAALENIDLKDKRNIRPDLHDFLPGSIPLKTLLED